LVKYYTIAGPHVDDTYRLKGFVYDCLPFAYQPGLINVSADKMKKASDRYERAKATAQKDSPEAMCPVGQIPLPRVRLKVLREGGDLQIKEKDFSSKTRSLSLAESATNLSLGKRTCSSDAGQQWLNKGYSYCQTQSYPVDATYVDVTLGVGGNSAPLPKLTGNTGVSGGHNINQLWWLGTATQYPYTISLEAGWVLSGAFAEELALTFFVYSTPDGYQSICSQGELGGKSDQYNLHGGFVQYSNIVAFGSPLQNFQAKIGYRQNEDSDGTYWELEYTPFTLNGYYEAYVLEETTSIGYWDSDRFSECYGGEMNQYSFGFEMNQGDFETVASGTIFQGGYTPSDTNVYTPIRIDTEFCNAPYGVGLTWNPNYLPNVAPNSGYLVTFSGDWASVSCVESGSVCPR